MPTPTNLITAEAAEYLRCSSRTMIRWRNARVGPPWTKVGQRVVYQRADLERYLDRQRVEPAREGAA